MELAKRLSSLRYFPFIGQPDGEIVRFTGMALYYVLSRGHDDSLVVLDIKLRLVDGFEHDDLGCLR